MENEIDVTSDAVQCYLGLYIYIDVTNIKKRIVNGDKLKQKIESMTDSLIERVQSSSILNDNDGEGSFLSFYNSNPQMYREVIVRRYEYEYKRCFPVLSEFNNEIKSHKEKVGNILHKLTKKGNKTRSEEEKEAIKFLRGYLNSDLFKKI
jgi:hypothetical protein